MGEGGSVCPSFAFLSTKLLNALRLNLDGAVDVYTERYVANIPNRTL